MTFADYLADKKLSDAAFGALCEPPIHRTRVHAYRTRRSRPSAEKIASIAKATGGMVAAEDWSLKAQGRKRRRAA